MLCKGTDNLPYIIRPSQVSVRQPSTRLVFRPVLVGEVTSTTSRRDQYCLLWATSTGPIADQYWSHLPPAVHSEEIAPKKALLIRGNSPYYNDYPPSREGSVSPLTEEGEMPHRTSLIAQPILVGGLTYIGSHRDQYRYIPSTYIGQPADQYRFAPPPHGGRANGLIRHGNLLSARDTKRPHEEGTTDSASTPTEVG